MKPTYWHPPMTSMTQATTPSAAQTPPHASDDTAQVAQLRLALQAALSRAEEAEQRLQLTLAAAGKSAWTWDRGTDLLRFEGLELAGRGLAWPAMSPAEFAARVHAADAAALRLVWDLIRRGASAEHDLSFRIDLGDQLVWVRMRGQALQTDAEGRVTRATGTLKDTTAQHQAEQATRVLSDTFSSFRDAVVIADADWHLVEVNPAFSHLVGLSTDALLGQDLRQYLHLPLAASHLPQPQPGQAWQGVCDVVDAMGVSNQVDATWRTVAYERVDVRAGARIDAKTDARTDARATDATLVRHLITLADLRDQRQAQAQLDQLAHTDPVTDLPNRAALERQLAQQLAQGAPFAVIYVDLDGLKDVNESFGLDAGDALLRRSAERLQGALPAGAFLCRWSGDEFVLVLPPDSGETEVRACAQGLIAAMAPLMQVSNNEVSAIINLGAVLAPRDGADGATLLHKAGLASQAAQRRGRNHLAFHDGEQDQAAQRRVLMQGLLRQAAKRNDFTFVAQPKVDRSGRSVGAEMLMRWHTEAFGQVSPVEFIALAERIGLIGLLGHHAIHAAAQLAARGAALGQPLPVAVNLSPKQLLQPGLDRQLLLACKLAGITPALLELELTESALVDNMDVIKPLLQRLRQNGFTLALDDFGTGFSSLSYLRHLPFHKIKIDRSFVMDIVSDPRAALLLGHIVQLCGSLGMSTVAEGVETRAQFELLCDLGVQEFQGYHFARPLPVDDWAALLAREPGVAPQLPSPA